MQSPPHRIRSRRRRGFNLVEACLAILILASVYLPLSQVFHVSTAGTISSRNHLVAQHLASNFFELYRVKKDVLLRPMSGAPVLTVTDLLGDQAAHELLTARAPAIENTLKYAGFTMKVEVERSVEGKIGLDRLEVRMDWKEDGHPCTRTHARLVAP